LSLLFFPFFSLFFFQDGFLRGSSFSLERFFPFPLIPLLRATDACIPSLFFFFFLPGAPFSCFFPESYTSHHTKAIFSFFLFFFFSLFTAYRDRLFTLGQVSLLLSSPVLKNRPPPSPTDSPRSRNDPVSFERLFFPPFSYSSAAVRSGPSVLLSGWSWYGVSVLLFFQFTEALASSSSPPLFSSPRPLPLSK